MSLKSIRNIELSYGPLVVSYIMTTGSAKYFHEGHGQWIIFIYRPRRFGRQQMVDIFTLPEHPDFKAGWPRSGYELLNQTLALEWLPPYRRMKVIAKLWSEANELQLREQQDYRADETAGLHPQVRARRRADRIEAIQQKLDELERFVKAYNHDDLAEIDRGEMQPPTGWRWFLRLLRLA